MFLNPPSHAYSHLLPAMALLHVVLELDSAIVLPSQPCAVPAVVAAADRHRGRQREREKERERERAREW